MCASWVEPLERLSNHTLHGDLVDDDDHYFPNPYFLQPCLLTGLHSGDYLGQAAWGFKGALKEQCTNFIATHLQFDNLINDNFSFGFGWNPNSPNCFGSTILGTASIAYLQCPPYGTVAANSLSTSLYPMVFFVTLFFLYARVRQRGLATLSRSTIWTDLLKRGSFLKK